MNKQILDLIDSLAEKEMSVTGTQFIAPVIPGCAVRVRLEGLVYTFKVNAREAGIKLLEAKNSREAKVSRKSPTRKQISDLLNELPKLQVLILEYFEGTRFGVQYTEGSRGLKLSGVFPVHLSDDASTFDIAQCRFDGLNVWFESTVKGNPRRARELRKFLDDNHKPEEVRVPYSTATDLLAYKLLYMRRNRVVQVAGTDVDDKTRLGRALSLAGADLQSYTDHGKNLHVRFDYAGRTHTATVDKETFTLISTGFCLRAEDRKFDLTSLVSVIRQKDDRYGAGRGIYGPDPEFGDDYGDDDY